MDDPDPGNLIFQIILLFVLILLNAFFAMSEIAIISLNDTKIAKMAEEGNKKAKQVLKLTADSSGFLFNYPDRRDPRGLFDLRIRIADIRQYALRSYREDILPERYSRRRYQRLLRRCHYAHNIVFFACLRRACA